jgi:flagellar hook-associated protein 1 FlgK
MGSTFGGIIQAGTGLTAANYGMQVVSQNIDNASTPGYTRQASSQVAVDGVAGVPTIYTSRAGMGGVAVNATLRLNDPVLDARSRAEHSRSAVTANDEAHLSSIEDVFPEPSDNGLTEQLNKYWNSWAPVGNDPGTAAPRSVLLGTAATVASTLNAMAASLDEFSGSVEQSMQLTSDEVNQAATSLGELNRQIAIGRATGTSVNALLDQRDVLLDQLSTAVGAKLSFNPNDTVDVTVGGQTLVSGTTVNAYAVGTGPTYPITVGGNPVTVSTGKAASDLKALTVTVPNYRGQLDAVADKLIADTNAAQAAGYDTTGNPGTPMFSGSGAAGITVAMTSPWDVAASSAPGGNLDGGNALAASRLGTNPGSADKLYTSLVGEIGQASKLAQQANTTQSSVTSAVDDLRTAASGVSTDEEISNLLTYQRAYQASSRVLTTMDDMLDQLINRTGLVGR